MAKSNRNRILENVEVIGKHLDKNEKWFQYPEKKMNKFASDAHKWDRKFQHRIKNFEAVMREFEKKMKSLEK